MKPFNLEKALAGEPVKLKNGLKAYVIKKLDSPEIGVHELVGFYETERKRQQSVSWFYNGARCDDFAVIGMWEEPTPKRFINGIEVPEPITEETWEDYEDYWYVDFGNYNFVGYSIFRKDSGLAAKLISQRLVFETKEGAKAMAKALLNYKVDIKSLE